MTEDVRSPCCDAELSITRQVHDTVVYQPTGLADGTLYVTYTKVYEGDGDAFEVICTKCQRSPDWEVEEQ